MTTRKIAVVLATLILALVVAGAAPRPAPAVSFVDKQVQAGGLLIQNYINAYGMQHGFVFPPQTMVKKGGGLEDKTRIWPSNPWTGRLMGPGSARGTYTYTLRSGGTAYALTMHLSSGKYAFTGRIPTWLKTERDTESKQSLLLLQRYVEAAAFSSHVYPATGAFTKDAYSAAAWPTNPWASQPMAPGTGLGDYVYAQKGGGTGYELRTKLASGSDFTLTQFPVGATLTTTPPPGN